MKISQVITSIALVSKEVKKTRREKIGIFLLSISLFPKTYSWISDINISNDRCLLVDSFDKNSCFVQAIQKPIGPKNPKVWFVNNSIENKSQSFSKATGPISHIKESMVIFDF